MTKPLTVKQQRFVEEFLCDSNATQASIRAGYSKKTAKDIGCENLAKPNITAAIEAGHKILRERCAVSVESLTEDLESARLLAMADKKGASAAVSAIMGKAKLHGLLIDKKELTGGLTHEEALAQLEGDEPVPVQQWRQ
jgi:phage terminase small subunit